MGKLSRDKGKAGEREIVKLLRYYGYEARRGQQHRGGPGSPDVIHSVPGLHIEVKRRETFDLYGSLQQAQDEAADGEAPVIFHRRNGRRWVIVMDAHDFLQMMKKIPLVNADGDNYSHWTGD